MFELEPRCCRVTVGIAVLLGLPQAFAGCPDVKLQVPMASYTISAQRPELVWSEASAKRYQIQVETRLPEGEVVARLNTVVQGGRIVPPVPLATTKAVVKVAVVEDCGGEPPPVTARGPTFFIDTAPACPSPGGLIVKEGALSWRGGGAQGYAVGAFAADGKVLLQRETRQTSLRLPEGTAYASVRARCAGGVSHPAFSIIGGS